MTQIVFNPNSYADQLRKYHPKEANRILVAYGWIDRIPRINIPIKDRIVTCKMCKELFKPKSGRQVYCQVNSQGQRCGYINKGIKYKNRRHEKAQSQFSEFLEGQGMDVIQ